MRFRVPELFLGVFLAVAIFAIGTLFGSVEYAGKIAEQPSERPAQKTSQEEPQDQGKKGWSLDATAIFTLGLVIVGVFQAGLFYFQLRLIRESLSPAKQAADAAKLNAEAIMAAETAHLYPAIVSDNLSNEVFRHFTWYEETSRDSELLPRPKIVFRFKNYGKTPAVLQAFMWGIEFYETPTTTRTLHATDHNVIEIIGAGEQSAGIEVEMMASFNRGIAKRVSDYRGELLFFGEASFKDFFDRRFKCIWECDGRPGGFRMVRYEQRANPEQ